MICGKDGTWHMYYQREWCLGGDRTARLFKVVEEQQLVFRGGGGGGGGSSTKDKRKEESCDPWV